MAFRSLALVLLLSTLAAPLQPVHAFHLSLLRQKMVRMRPEQNLAMTSSADASSRLGQESVVIHRLDHKTGMCAELDLPQVIARFAVRMAGMKYGHCVQQGYSHFVEHRAVENRFGKFKARFFRNTP